MVAKFAMKCMFKTTCISSSPSVRAAAEERDERIHDQVGELSAVFCIPRSREIVRFSDSVPGAERACRDVRGA